MKADYYMPSASYGKAETFAHPITNGWLGHVGSFITRFARTGQEAANGHNQRRDPALVVAAGSRYPGNHSPAQLPGMRLLLPTPLFRQRGCSLRWRNKRIKSFRNIYNGGQEDAT